MSDMAHEFPPRTSADARASLRRLGPVLALVVLALLPFAFRAAGYPFLTDALNRMAILAVAAVGLNFLVFKAGLVSFGHAVFFGIGAYAVGISSHFGYDNGFLHLAAALGVSGLFAFLTGLLALRTRGLHFLMITLAFSQVVYYVMIGLDEFGGDDGLVVYANSEFPLLDLGDKDTLYWVTLGVLALLTILFSRMSRSRFGLVLSAANGSEQRVRSSGLDAFRYRLVAYVIASMSASLAGLLSANLTSFVTPDRMDWMHSGELLFVVTIGGMGSVVAPIVGAAVFIFLEELLSSLTIYWHFWFGAILVVSVLGGRPWIAKLGSLGGRREP